MTEGLVNTALPPPLEAVESGSDLWQSCLSALAAELPEQQFNTWIKPLTARVAQDASKVTVFVANRFKLDWVRAQYAGRITALINQFGHHDTERSTALELVLAPRESFVRGASNHLALDGGVETLEGTSAPQARILLDEPQDDGFKTRLNSTLSFDSLVEGSANRMARAAAMHVAANLGNLYNPLFIYGGVGLGKTHLMHAIGNQMLAAKPDSKVLYIHAEQFVSDVVKAYQGSRF